MVCREERRGGEHPYVSKGYDPKTAYKKEFKVHDFHFLTEEVAMERVTFK